MVRNWVEDPCSVSAGWAPLDTLRSRTAQVLASHSQSSSQEYSLRDAWNSQPLPVFLLVKALISVIAESKHQKGMNPDNSELVWRWSRWCKFYLQCLHSSWIRSRILWGIKRVAYGLIYLSSSQVNCLWVGQQKASFSATDTWAPQTRFLLQYGIAQTAVHLPLSANSAVLLVPHNSNCELERKKRPLLFTPWPFLPDQRRRRMIPCGDSQPFSQSLTAAGSNGALWSPWVAYSLC